MDKQYTDIDAVHSDDLERLLQKIGILESFKSGKIKCKFSSDIVTHENIYSVVKDSGTYKLVCDKAECVKDLMEFVATRKKKIN